MKGLPQPDCGGHSVLFPVRAFLPKLKNQLDNKIRIGYYLNHRRTFVRIQKRRSEYDK